VRRISLLLCLLALPASPAAAAAPPGSLQASLSRHMRAAGGFSGAFVLDVTTHQPLFSRHADVPRTPASVEKLPVTSTALLRLGPDATLPTTVLGAGQPDADGVFRGDLWLKGFGDPTFGSDRFVRRAYGAGGRISDLAAQLADAGITRVAGRVLGDESYFDTRRGPPSSGFGLTFEVGVLSALSYNRGLATENGGGFQRHPAAFAARQLVAALRHEHIKVDRAPSTGIAPKGATELATTQSPTIARLVQLTNRPSDNFLAEMLIKGLGAHFGGAGSTAAGANVVGAQMAKLGVHWNVVDGSGLSRADRVTPSDVVRLLDRMSTGVVGDQFTASLAVAGRSGTLTHRMRGTAAEGRCRAKTGTLNFVANLAGYCHARGGDTIAFAFLMNGVNVLAARRAQDRMAAALANYAGG
jgi:serine-type D-Ala-D-Ala carboxypeptidase/endopeptidase (penicillin-binding protein 4)